MAYGHAKGWVANKDLVKQDKSKGEWPKKEIIIQGRKYSLDSVHKDGALYKPK